MNNVEKSKLVWENITLLYDKYSNNDDVYRAGAYKNALIKMGKYGEKLFSKNGYLNEIAGSRVMDKIKEMIECESNFNIVDQYIEELQQMDQFWVSNDTQFQKKLADIWNKVLNDSPESSKRKRNAHVIHTESELSDDESDEDYIDEEERKRTTEYDIKLSINFENKKKMKSFLNKMIDNIGKTDKIAIEVSL